jgi:hypothetical protein
MAASKRRAATQAGNATVPQVTPELTVSGGPRARLTVRQLWEWLTDAGVSDALLDWAPDVAALTSVLLQRTHAFRFVVSPPAGRHWPPTLGDESFGSEVGQIATRWRSSMDRGSEPPRQVRQAWSTIIEHWDTPVADMAEGTPWSLCEAVLLLHAIADEASACWGGGGAGRGATHRAQAREMLARRGTMARLPVDRLAHLPKTRTTPVGITHRSLSRYSCTSTSGITAVWHRLPIRRPGTEPAARTANVLLLPWPLRIRESDFVPVTGSIRRPEREPFGYFRYEPSEPLDLGLVDRLLDAALDEVDTVDVVALPEGALAEGEIEALESLLARRHVALLVSGVRPEPAQPDRFPSNGLHVGVLLGGQWNHIRQNKHHRWFLDAGQIEQYNIAGALHPSVRWWEAMEIPQRAVHFLEVGGGITIAAVVCEDLARLDVVAELVRSVGPTMVVTLLLDGPQLASRWTARYAGVLADDPGSAVLTLTAMGMVARSQPDGMPPSRVVAMWKDPFRGLREVPLEPGAQGVLLKTVLGTSPRYAADGRAPADDASDLYVAGVHQLHAGPAATTATAPPRSASQHPATAAPLDPMDMSVLSAWADAVADAIDSGSPTVADVLAEARAGAAWRSAGDLPEPSAALDRVARAALERAQTVTVDGVMTALQDTPTDGVEYGRLARSLLRAGLDAARVT